MVPKVPIFPQRLRKVPPQFSWIDQRLVRERHIARLSHRAAALYLFLVTVGDAKGLSYYGDKSIGKYLSMDQDELEDARTTLVRTDLIAFKTPLYQVLALDDPQQARTSDGPLSLGEILNKARETHDDRL